MEDLSLHILDIAQNAIRANAKTITVLVEEDESKDRCTVCIKDDGQGMDEEMIEQALDPFFTTKSGKKIGLGLSLLSQAAQQAGGELKVISAPGLGSKVTAFFQRSHLDMKPLGDILATISVLTVGNPSIRFIYDYKKGRLTFHFDSELST